MQAEPKTRRGRESRDRIVECAAMLIAERGVEHVGLDDVLTAAGVGKGQLYYYFADRDALVEAAVARRCAQVQEALARMFGGLDSLAELELALDAYVGIYEETLAGCPIGRIATEVAGRNDGAQRHVETAFDAWQALFADLFTRLRERGDLRPDADPAELATALLAALEGGQILSQTRHNSTSLRIAIAAALGHIRTFHGPRSTS
jgi:TetR/AcrR family transcriptional regulator, transcriptional repressor for nem operon